MNQTPKSIAAEMHEAARNLEAVRETMLKYNLLSKGKSYDRQVMSLINKLDGEGDKVLVAFARSIT
jgi:hypothetical protein